MAIKRRQQLEEARSGDPHGPLEAALMDEFLSDRGHTLQSVSTLPLPERRELLRQAASYATLRLAEIEARAHLVDNFDE